MTEFNKLVRPLMRGVKTQIRSGMVSEIKNNMVRDVLAGLPSFTGEVVVGQPIDAECRQITEQFLEIENLVHPFIFWVYDMQTTHSYPLQERLRIAQTMITACGPCIQYVEHEFVTNKKELDNYVQKVVTENFFPGIVLREPYSTFGTQDEEIPAVSLGLEVQ